MDTLDLDALIRSADPARQLTVPPGNATAILHRQSTRRRSVLRPLVVAGVVGVAVLGGGIAVGAVTGVIDLGGGRSAQPVHSAPFRTDRAHPYLYRVDGPVPGRDGTGPIYIESSRPLATSTPGHINAARIIAARHACRKQTTRKHLSDGQLATVWIFDSTCYPGRP